MTLNKIYKNAVLYPAFVAIIIATVFSIVDNYNYKSEWMTAEYVILTSIAFGFIYVIIICALSLPIFLNNFQLVKKNKLLTLLCWLLLPFIFITMVIIHEIWFSLNFETKLGSEFIYILILNLPFVFGLIKGYLKYRKLDFK